MFASGNRPSLCVHGERDIAVVIYEKAGKLYFRVGRVDKDNFRIRWGERNCYGSGTEPSVALVCINNEVFAIIAYRLKYTRSVNRCCYSIGTIVPDQLTIRWGNEAFLCKGKKPQVGASDNGTVIVIREGSYSINAICYHQGAIDINGRVIDWQRNHEGHPRKRAIENVSGVQPTVAVNRDSVVVVYRSCLTSHGSRTELWDVVGTFNPENDIIWGQTTPMIRRGENPSVSLNNDGNLVEIYRNPWNKLLYHIHGRLGENRLIHWNPSHMHFIGKSPSVSLCDDGYICEVHRGFRSKLCYSNGELRYHQRVPVREPEPGGDHENEDSDVEEDEQPQGEH